MRRSRISFLCFAFSIIFINACRTSKTTDTDHELLVANGQKIESIEFPAVVMMKVGEGLCTGTFVSDFQVLTAAHCVENVKSIQIIEKQGLSGLFGFRVIEEAERWAAHPLYSIKTKGRYDLAVVEFPKGTASSVVQLKNVRPRLGETITIVGFGNNNITPKIVDGDLKQTGSGYKRKGQNRINEITDGQLIFIGSLSEQHALRQGYQPGQRVGLGSGDSGGPMFNEKGELIGIASGVDVNTNAQGDVLTYFSRFCDLNSESSRQFLVEYGLMNVAPGTSN